jgi:hypothetical protein
VYESPGREKNLTPDDGLNLGSAEKAAELASRVVGFVGPPGRRMGAAGNKERGSYWIFELARKQTLCHSSITPLVKFPLGVG